MAPDGKEQISNHENALLGYWLLGYWAIWFFCYMAISYIAFWRLVIELLGYWAAWIAICLYGSWAIGQFGHWAICFCRKIAV